MCNRPPTRSPQRANRSRALIVGFGLALGVFCRESVAYTTPEDVLAAAKEANPTFPEERPAVHPAVRRG